MFIRYQPFVHGTHSQDTSLWWVDNGRKVRHTAHHAQIRLRERTALKLGRLQLTVTRLGRQARHIRADLLQALFANMSPMQLTTDPCDARATRYRIHSCYWIHSCNRMLNLDVFLFEQRVHLLAQSIMPHAYTLPFNSIIREDDSECIR